MTAAFRLDHVAAGYGPIAVLEDASMELPVGGLLGMIGPNGAGKSTVLRLLLGTLAPFHGTVEVLGTTPRLARKRVGYVPQTLSVARDLPATLLEVVTTGFVGLLPPWRSPGTPERERALAWCERLRIAHLAGRRLSELSGGQLQRALVARALVREPELLLLDEPTANADARAEANLFDLLSDFSRDRTTVLVSHDVGVLSRHVRSIACVGAGRIVHHDGPEIPAHALEDAYGCPVDLIAHGHPHRVLSEHEGCDHDHGGEA